MASIGVNSNVCTTRFPDNTELKENISDEFTVSDAMNSFIGKLNVTGEDKNYCGLFGYTSFDAVRYFEHIPVPESHERFAGIDLNSRFEISPALKDVEMLSRFIKELRK